MFSKQATKIEKIFTVDLTLGKRQIDGEDFVAFLENMNFKQTICSSAFGSSFMTLYVILAKIHKKWTENRFSNLNIFFSDPSYMAIMLLAMPVH